MTNNNNNITALKNLKLFLPLPFALARKKPQWFHISCHISSRCLEEIWLLNFFPSNWKVKSKCFIITKTTWRIVDFTEAIIFEIGGEKSEEIWSHRIFFFFPHGQEKRNEERDDVFKRKNFGDIDLAPKIFTPIR